MPFFGNHGVVLQPNILLYEEQGSLASSVAFLKAIVIDAVWHMVTTRLIPIISVLVASWNIVSLEHKLEIVQLFKKRK